MISQVTSKQKHGNEEQEFWFLFDTEHETLFDLYDDLKKTGVVYGYRLKAENAGQGRRRIVGEYEYIIGIGAVLHITPPTFIVEYAQEYLDSKAS